MTSIAVLVLAGAIVILLVLLVAREVRWEERVDRLEDERAEERRVAAGERRELYQRIQAPEMAVRERARAERPARRRPRPIAADDDARYRRDEDGDGG